MNTPFTPEVLALYTDIELFHWIEEMMKYSEDREHVEVVRAELNRRAKEQEKFASR